jgi:hypothetical protein
LLLKRCVRARPGFGVRRAAPRLGRQGPSFVANGFTTSRPVAILGATETFAQRKPVGEPLEMRIAVIAILGLATALPLAVQPADPVIDQAKSLMSSQLLRK